MHLLFFDVARLPSLALVQDLVTAFPKALPVKDACGHLHFHDSLIWAKHMLKVDRGKTVYVLEKYPLAATAVSMPVLKPFPYETTETSYPYK
jgi:hypothetical protein